MNFRVLGRFATLPSGVPNAALVSDSWNDFGYKTLYSLKIRDEAGEIHLIGGIKIGQFAMGENEWQVSVPPEFDELDERYFSIGQDDSYYENLNKLGPNIRNEVLKCLRDIALDQDLLQRALSEKVTGVSLLRSVTIPTIKGQFRRLARGGVRLSRFRFVYTIPSPPQSSAPPVSLSFAVEPESYPPTNIHVLIGRNGIGKTHLLHHMSKAIIEKNAAEPRGIEFVPEGLDASEESTFANLVSVTFSAFDPFEPLPNRRDKSKGIQYAYICLKRSGKTSEGTPLSPKTPEKLSTEFGNSIALCRKGARAVRWRRALEMLESDPIFQDAGIVSLCSEDEEEEELKAKAGKLFGRLSSGHKIVLLTVTRLVETVVERTLVLLDEPEAHLHPPLLSAFIRSLSDLLTDRNGVAVIATHSPVVLQEVPRSCAWKIRRTGKRSIAERPEIETFGENVGTLTREVFGLEVTHSGFHKMLRDAFGTDSSFDTVVERFGGELGGEAKAIIRALIAARD